MSEFRTPVKSSQSRPVAETPIIIPPSPYMQRLGYGTGVTVYRLERHDQRLRSPWAIKRISRQCRERKSSPEKQLYHSRMLQEAGILRRLQHPNIVGFRSLVTDVVTGDSSLALECCSISLGDLLEQRLDEYGMIPLPVAQIKVVIRDVARALDYLHTEAFLMHGDLKSHNVLVKGDFQICKLCDFGVSVPLDESSGELNMKLHPEHRYVGTPVWSAPEIVLGELVISSRAEIFSFGLVVYEMIALVPPHTLGMDEEEEEEEIEEVEDEEDEGDEEKENEEEEVKKMENINAKRVEEDSNSKQHPVNERKRMESKDEKHHLETKLEHSESKIENSICSNKDNSNNQNNSKKDGGECNSSTSSCLICEEEEEEDVSLYDDFPPGCGTRPSLPEDLELDSDYHEVLEIFYLCTNPEPNMRPSAKQILESMSQ